MKKIALATGAALAALSGFAYAQQDAPMSGPEMGMTRTEVAERVGRHFDRLDQDQDGRVTREEARHVRTEHRDRMLDERFRQFDLDGDNSISAAEWREAHVRMRDRGEGHQAVRVMHHRQMAHGMGERLFEGRDFVTREQMLKEAIERFDRADQDGDGRITAAERRQVRIHAHERMQERIHAHERMQERMGNRNQE